MPSQINDNVGQIMADIRAMANAVATGWIEIGDGEGTYTATYVSATSFRFDGVDVTAYYRAGMRVRVVAPTPGTLSGTIASSAFSTHTTLVVAWDSGSLSNEAITSVSLGVGSGDTAAQSRTVYHDCRQDYVSTSVIRLNRCNGAYLTIDNAPQAIPAAGVDLAPTGLLPATPFYYVYAYMAAGVMTLEAVTTAHAADARNGIRVKSGDATRTLVGQVIVITGPVFESTLTRRYVSSYYNRKPLMLSVAASSSTGSLTAAGVGGALGFLGWAGETQMMVALSGYVTSNLEAVVFTQALFDGSTSVLINNVNSYGGKYNHNGAAAIWDVTTDGYHYSHLAGWVSTAVGTWGTQHQVSILG
jgi:hypothetical protein